ncbi:MAG: DUF465 domain-containing protein [Alphaproteobacteria bacterium]|nr:DUF465 domain-containing protein [Alphaproteobacteria bacterium]
MEAKDVSDLKARHAELEAKLDAEKRRNAPNATMIAELKRAKLRIKDRLAVLAHA